MNVFLRNSGIFLIYLLIQVVVFNQFTLFDVATPFVFLLFLLMLPLNLRFSISLIIAFVVGMLVDWLSFNAFKGIHAFSSVLMMSVRLPWVNLFSSRFSYHGSEEYLLQVQPLRWHIQYQLPLILVHQFSYFILEAFSFDNFPYTFLKIATSSLYTFGFCILLTLWFYKSNKR